MSGSDNINHVKEQMQAGTGAKKIGLFHPKFHLPSPTPPMDPKSADDMNQWIKGVMEYVEHTSLRGKNLLKHNGAWKIHLVFNNFPPEYLEYYQTLQQKIAEKVHKNVINTLKKNENDSTEEYRPTITLKIRGSKRQDQRPFYGYIGGTGPLSDAATILTVRNAYEVRQGVDAASEHMAVDLLSSPPPRTHATISHWFRYGVRVSKLTEDCGAENIALLSNTAHLNLFIAKSAMYTRRVFNFIFKQTLNPSNTVIHSMVKRVIQNIKAGNDNQSSIRPYKDTDKILILGTETAFKNHLYDHHEEAKGMRWEYPGHPNNQSSDAEKLQKFIDLIKSDKTNAFNKSQDTVGEALVDFILKNIKGDTSHILLACTELPMCFHTKLPDELLNKYSLNKQEATYADLFIYKFNQLHPNKAAPIILDTEVMFADLTVDQMLINQEKYDKAPVQPKKVGHSLTCSPVDKLGSDQAQTPTHTKDSIPVPRSVYENTHAFKQLDHFADENLIIYRPPDQSVSVDFDSLTQSDAIKREMIIATIESGLKLGVTQPIELSGDDVEAVKTGATYCKQKGIGFYVADDMAYRLTPDLQCGEPTLVDVPALEVEKNIASLTQAPVTSSKPRPGYRM